jgi:hypothetical protein
MISLLLQKRSLFNANFIGGNKKKSTGTRSGEYDGCCTVATFSFDKKSSTENEQCAEALS